MLARKETAKSEKIPFGTKTSKTVKEANVATKTKHKTARAANKNVGTKHK